MRIIAAMTGGTAVRLRAVATRGVLDLHGAARRCPSAGVPPRRRRSLGALWYPAQPVRWPLVLLLSSAVIACSEPVRAPELVGPRNLKVLAEAGPLAIERVVYVPIYSSLYLADHAEPIDLAATLSLRNVSQSTPVVLTAVDYYDSDGALVRAMLDAPAELGPLMSAEYFVSRADRVGGSGANFLVHWGLREPGPDLLVEAIMHGRDGNAGVSFLTEGRVVEEAARKPVAK